MGLELLREADMILNQCGRPTPPPGVKFVDLPRVLGYTKDFVSGGDATPASERIENKANTLFIVDGISVSGALAWRIKWPTGRSFSQNLLTFPATMANPAYPQGRGATQYKLSAPEPIPTHGRITVETFPSGATENVLIQLWGRLRFLVVEKGAAAGAVSCIVGYPTTSRERSSAADLPMIPNPVQALKDLPRYPACTPNGNIMAPEFRLGNQPTPETPAGFRDESFSFSTPAVTVVEEAVSIANPVCIVPGNDLVVLRRIRPISTWDGGPAPSTAVPTFSLRLPNGYNWTGGDLIQTGPAWFYFFPELIVPAGQRLIFDVSNIDGSAAGVGSVTTYFELEGVKRRKLQ